MCVCVCVRVVDDSLGGLSAARCLYEKLHVGGGGTFRLNVQFKNDYCAYIYSVVQELFVLKAHDMSTSHCSITAQ